MKTKFVLFSKNGDSFFPHFIGSAHDSNGYFTAICDQDFFKDLHVSPYLDLSANFGCKLHCSEP
jgi:hypothetical protein